MVRQGTVSANTAFVAFLVGFIMFFVFRGVLRTLPGLVHLILGVLVGVGVYYLLRAWIY